MAVARAGASFGRALRSAGLAAGPTQELDFCRALAELDPSRREHVYWAARASFVSRPEDVAAFEPLFERFWRGEPLERAPALAEHGADDPRLPGSQHGGESLPQLRRTTRLRPVDGGGTRAAAPLELPTATQADGGSFRRGVLAAYSPDESMVEPEPLGLRPEELAALRRLAAEFRRTLPRRRSRRLQPARRGRLDLARTLRRSLATGGEPLRLSFVGGSRRPRRLVLLCDVSGSMDRYAPALLASLRAAVGAGRGTEAFVFATRLTRLTRALAEGDAEAALARARGRVGDWSGGTRIGAALACFRRDPAGAGLAHGAVIVVVSDGWDRGDPEALARELAHLRLRCWRLVWVNPRPSDLDGQPLALGMRAALPYVDDYFPGFDLRQVALLPQLFGLLGPHRPGRAQRLSWEAR